MREVALDTETSGLNPEIGHRIIEIAAIELVNQAPTGRTFHQLINPERSIDADATRVHGHTENSLRGKPVFAEIVNDFLDFIGDAKIVGHNVGFDLRFLNAELARLGLEAIADDRTIDTLSLARKKFPGAIVSLDALCDRFKIDRTRRVLHGALVDTELLCDVYVELLGGKQRSLVLEADKTLDPSAAAPVAIGPRPPRVSRIEPGEWEAHRDFVATINDAVWKAYAALANAEDSAKAA